MTDAPRSGSGPNDPRLPLYVNRTLSAGETAEVEDLLARDTAAAREVELLRALAASVREAAETEMAETNSPGAFGLARLEREIGRERRAAPARPRRGLAQLALAASLALAVGLGVGLLGAPVVNEPGYRAAGGGEVAGGAAVAVVAFRADASAQEIGRLLRETELRLVDGPSALGLYRVAPRPGAAERSVPDILEALRARGDVVEQATQVP